jgi:hypothetical protein
MKRTICTIVLFGIVLATGCGHTPLPLEAAPGVQLSRMTVTSQNFLDRAAVPIDESCDGKDVSPSLTWSAPPETTKSLAIVVDDLDSSPPQYTHWMLYDLSPSTLRIPEGFEPNAEQGKVGVNDFKNARYNGPCPPKETFHRYRFRVLALDAPSGLKDGATREQLDAALNGHLIGVGSLEGTFVH